MEAGQGLKPTSTKTPAIVTIVASALLCISAFLPYTIAVEDLSSFIQTSSSLPMFASQSGLSVGDLESPSLFSWASVFLAADLDQGNGSVIVSLIIWIAGLFSLLSLLCAALRKATPTAVFALLALGILAMISWMFDSALLESGICKWGFGHTLGFIASFLTIASSIWLFVAKKSAKRAACMSNAVSHSESA